MKYFVFSISLLICLTLSFGADCEFDGKPLKIGETHQPEGTCSLYSCDRPGFISGKTCPSVTTLEPCKELPPDVSKPFPMCCPTFAC